MPVGRSAGESSSVASWLQASSLLGALRTEQKLITKYQGNGERCTCTRECRRCDEVGASGGHPRSPAPAKTPTTSPGRLRHTSYGVRRGHGLRYAVRTVASGGGGRALVVAAARRVEDRSRRRVLGELGLEAVELERRHACVGGGWTIVIGRRRICAVVEERQEAHAETDVSVRAVSC